jgi:predicted N-acyltransferase
MRKTFKLAVEGKNRDRVLEAVKHEVRKYLKRERRRALPEGVDYWDFDCKFGTTQDAAEVVHLATLIGHMDAVAQAGGEQFYVEILAKHGHRQARPEGSTDRVTSAAAAANFLDDPQ